MFPHHFRDLEFSFVPRACFSRFYFLGIVTAPWHCLLKVIVLLLFQLCRN